MADQLRLNVDAPPAEPGKPFVGQLTELPGSTWEDIFDIPADDAAAPVSRGDEA